MPDDGSTRRLRQQSTLDFPESTGDKRKRTPARQWGQVQIDLRMPPRRVLGPIVPAPREEILDLAIPGRP